MQRQGCKPDAIVYNAIIEALFDTGLACAQRKARALFRQAQSEVCCDAWLIQTLTRWSLIYTPLLLLWRYFPSTAGC